MSSNNKRFNLYAYSNRVENNNKMYTLSSEIGKGTFSNVFSINPNQCIKIFKKSYSKYGMDEMAILTTVKSGANFSKIIESFNYDGHYCIVMERYDTNLYKYYFKNTVCTNDVHKIASSILNGLCFLRKNKIVHNDLKPENIFVSTSGTELENVVIGDFSSSFVRCSVKDEATSNQVTLWYRAPEIYLLRKSTCSSDMWAFGCILYEIITKKPLFKIKQTDTCYKDNNLLYEKHTSFIGISTVKNPIVIYKPAIVSTFFFDNIIFKTKYATVILESIKWEQELRMTPDEAILYISKNHN
jgi:serine/threonine protein kinase